MEPEQLILTVTASWVETGEARRNPSRFARETFAVASRVAHVVCEVRSKKADSVSLAGKETKP